MWDPGRGETGSPVALMQQKLYHCKRLWQGRHWNLKEVREETTDTPQLMLFCTEERGNGNSSKMCCKNDKGDEIKSGGVGRLEVLWEEGKEIESLLFDAGLTGDTVWLESIVLPDVSDSYGHGGPWIQHFPLIPIPPARPLYPCDKKRKCSVSSSVTVLLTHSFTHPFIPFSFPWPLCLKYTPFTSFLPSFFFFYPHLCLFNYRLFLHLFSILLISCSVPFPLTQCSFFSPWIGSAEVVGTKTEQVVNTCLLS